MNTVFLDLGIEMDIPAGWSSVDVPHADRMFMAEEQFGYKSNLAISLEQLEPATPQRFEELISQIPAALARRHGTLEIIRQERFLQDDMPAWFIRYRWSHADTPHPFEQLTILIMVDIITGAAIQVDASTLVPLADQFMPMFNHMVSSVKSLSRSAPREFPCRNIRNHFSYHTYASFQLPVEWDEVDSSAGYALYQEDTDALEELVDRPATLVVKIASTGKPTGNEPATMIEHTSAIERISQRVIDRSTTIVDGRQAQTITLVFHDDHSSQELFLYQAAFLSGDILYTFSGSAEAYRREELLPQLLQALHSLRVIPFQDAMFDGDSTTVFDETLMLSTVLPAGWRAEWAGELHLRFFGLPEPDLDNYCPTISFQAVPAEGYDLDWFESVIAELGQSMAESYHRFRPVLDVRFQTSDLAFAHFRRFEWVDEESGLHFSQFQIVTPARSGYLYVVNGATRKESETRHLAAQVDIFEGTRLIPEYE
ncbi:hypothetical protein [Desulfurispira natronophila]|uniref:Uncharacterized protein n=1 Tax=Desulfurispira natronophila TaxID=682562 RepID=A0A7W8DGL4_9BACT|nr:hypothetical protein [Desulfurispira natronophila]MBB5021497.1 hypothetical protein [Desulfurispira natronophila]